MTSEDAVNWLGPKDGKWLNKMYRKAMIVSFRFVSLNWTTNTKSMQTKCEDNLVRWGGHGKCILFERTQHPFVQKCIRGENKRNCSQCLQLTQLSFSASSSTAVVIYRCYSRCARRWLTSKWVLFYGFVRLSITFRSFQPLYAICFAFTCAATGVTISAFLLPRNKTTL